MLAFDQIVMVVGVALIIIGLILFVAGKKESDKNNHVEGFGIKVNVSNPSVILIVLGCGLMLTPRLLPEPQSSQPQNLQPKTTYDDGSSEDKKLPIASLDRQPDIVPQVPQEQPKIGLKPDNISRQAAVYFPQGRWQLSSYEENGVNLSSNVSGDIQFSAQAQNRYLWSANLFFIDIWGNTSNYQYHGSMDYQATGYRISFASSNDPGFIAQSNVAMELKTENGGVLHMGYFYNNSQILLHWTQ